MAFDHAKERRSKRRDRGDRKPRLVTDDFHVNGVVRRRGDGRRSIDAARAMLATQGKAWPFDQLRARRPAKARVGP